MTLLQQVIETFEQLPESLQIAASHYIEFLYDQHTKKLEVETPAPKENRLENQDLESKS